RAGCGVARRPSDSRQASVRVDMESQPVCAPHAVPDVATCPAHLLSRHRERPMTQLPFRPIALLLGALFLACFVMPIALAGEKHTFVLVHGATAGGWEWKRAGQFLTDDGHTVYRPTLTGLGEREHLN